MSSRLKDIKLKPAFFRIAKMPSPTYYRGQIQVVPQDLRIAVAGRWYEPGDRLPPSARSMTVSALIDIPAADRLVGKSSALVVRWTGARSTSVEDVKAELSDIFDQLIEQGKSKYLQGR